METNYRRLIVTAGLAVGLVSFFLLLTGAAVRYSDNAAFCLNCHTMVEPYETLQASNHKQFLCTDCHAPHDDYMAKVSFKFRSGMRDLYATTLGDIPQVIRNTPESEKIITENCIRCHYSTVEKTGMGEGRLCTDCHRYVAHNKLSEGKVH